MMRPRGLPALAGAMIVTLLAGSAHADLAKCQKALEKNGDKLRGAIWKTLAKCKDGYQGAVAKAEALNVKAGPSCQLGLDKVLNAGNPLSTMGKTKAALDKLTALNLCTDQDLLVLGYLPPSVFGDHWARWLMIASLKAAYESQISFVGLTANIFQALAANGCPICADLGRPPCLRASCPLLAGDGAAPVAASEAEAKILDASTTFYVRSPVSSSPKVASGPGDQQRARDGRWSRQCAQSVPDRRTDRVLAHDPEPGVHELRRRRDCEHQRVGLPGLRPERRQPVHDRYLSERPRWEHRRRVLQLHDRRGHGWQLGGDEHDPDPRRVCRSGGADGVACTADDTAPPTPPNTIVVTTGTAQATLRDAGDVPGPTSAPAHSRAQPVRTARSSPPAT
jgi:hypothetical protein